MNDFDLIDISEDESIKPSNEETIEMLDFENDIKVSSEIDEMLDFIEITPKEKQKEELDKLLDNITDSNTNPIDAKYNASSNQVPLSKVKILINT